MTEPSIAALIVAAGRGARAGGDVPKQYRSLAGEPVLRRTLRRFLDHPAVGPVLAVIGPGDEALYEESVEGLQKLQGLLPPVRGGSERQASVLNGLKALEALASEKPQSVLIHDGARPLLPPEVVTRCVKALETHDGAVASVPVADTLLKSSGGRFDGVVPRERLHRAQTPQAFRFEAILAAHKAASPGFTDDASLAAAHGLDVVLVEGDERNMKITAPEDFERAAALIGGERLLLPHTGFGYDVHRFEPGSEVTICGIAIPHDRRLAGHSDADVGLHAITDALLGTISDGDIGQHFPPSDPRWKGAGSDVFLADAADRVRARGGRIAHIDVTIICERPKIGPHRQAMRERIAAILRIGVGNVSVKATTTEGLGFTGRSEGIAAQAVATALLPDGDADG